MLVYSDPDWLDYLKFRVIDCLKWKDFGFCWIEKMVMIHVVIFYWLGSFKRTGLWSWNLCGGRAGYGWSGFRIVFFSTVACCQYRSRWKIKSDGRGVQRQTFLLSLIACPTAAINWSLKYFLGEDLRKSTLNLLWAGKYMHTFTVPPARGACWLFLIGKLQWFAQVVRLKIVSHFVESVFSGCPRWWELDLNSLWLCPSNQVHGWGRGRS